jgi:hypothetical protein
LKQANTEVLTPAYSKASPHRALSNPPTVNQVADGFAGTCLEWHSKAGL